MRCSKLIHSQATLLPDRRYFMPAVAPIFRDLLMLRRGPQDLPYSPRLLISLVVTCALVQAVAGMLPTAASFIDALISALFELVLVLAALRIALRARGLGNRWMQSGSAIVGCNLIFTAISVPMLLVFGQWPIESGHIVAEKLTSEQLSIALLLAALGVWQFAVNAQILRHSLNLSLFGAIAVIVGWIVLLTLLLNLVSAAPA